MRIRWMKLGSAMLIMATMSTATWAFEFKNTPRNLQQLFEMILSSNAKGDIATAAMLTKSLMPTRERILKALRTDVSPKVVDKIAQMYSKMINTNMDDATYAKMLARKPERSQIYLYGATTDKIAANQKGSIVYKEFPGGSVEAAKTILRPNMWFYEVERVEPGKSSGFKMHLFFWDGQKWCMMGAVWRALH